MDVLPSVINKIKLAVTKSSPVSPVGPKSMSAMLFHGKKNSGLI